MARINPDDVVAVYQGPTLYCSGCVDISTLDELESDQIFTQDDIDASDDLFFCDQCKAKL